MSRDYARLGGILCDTVDAVSGSRKLTGDQRLTLIGAAALLFDGEFKAGRAEEARVNAIKTEMVKRFRK